MISYALFLAALTAQSPPTAEPEILPANSRLLSETRKKGTEIFAYVPEGHSLRQLPATTDELEVWTQVDRRWRMGQREYLVRSAQDMFPRDLLSLESRRYGVLRDARNLLLNMAKGADATRFTVAPRMADTPLSTRKAVLGGVFTGYDEVPSTAGNLACSMVIAPGYVFKDRQTGQEKSFALDRLPWRAKPETTGLPAFARSSELEELRTRTLATLATALDAKPVDLQPGIYPAKTLFDLATAGVTDRFRLDKRFQNFRLLVVPAKPLTRFDLLTGIARSLDLYPRSLGAGWLFAVSPGDPYEFYARKSAIEERDLAGDILKRLYATGRIPSYIPPEAFYVPESDLAPDLKERLVSDLNGGASTSYASQKDKMAKALTDPSRWRVSCYLSICIALHDRDATFNGCTTYP
jgi:hypothetical protein